MFSAPPIRLAAQITATKTNITIVLSTTTNTTKDSQHRPQHSKPTSASQVRTKLQKKKKINMEKEEEK